MDNEEYTKKLEAVIKQMLQPVKGIPLNLVIESMSGCKIIPFDKQSQDDVKLLEILKIAAEKSAIKFNSSNKSRRRPNEIGNDIEPYVKEVLSELGCKAKTPQTISGKMKSTGYPDIEFTDLAGRLNYLECKTFNIDNVATTQRSFYLSPSEDFKITKNAHHFIISFEVFVASNNGQENIYKCSGWKILSVDALEVDIKYEFNSDNARLYNPKLLLADGKLILNP